MDFTELIRFEDEMTASTVPGMDISVAVDGREVFRRQSGYSDIESGTKMRGDELFFLWSGTKLITSSLGMRLVEEGRLDLDAPVYEYLPEYRSLTVRTVTDGREEIHTAENTMLVSQLFSMTAGFDYNFASPEIADVRRRTDGHCPTREIAKAIAKMPLSFEPGTHFEYSKCHDVLAAVIEVAAGKKMRDYARETLFDPLGMNDTFYGQPNDSQQARMATQYLWRGDLGKAVPTKKVCNMILGDEYDSGGAGVVTSCDDYMKFASTLACGGTAKNGYCYLLPTTIEKWANGTPLNDTQQAEFEGKWGMGHTYGYGVRRIVDHRAFDADDRYNDFGWGGAAGMRVHISPDAHVSAILLTHILELPDARLFEKRFRNTVFRCLTE